MRSIDSLPPSFDLDKPFLKVHALHDAKLHDMAVDAIQDLQIGDQIGPNLYCSLPKYIG